MLAESKTIVKKQTQNLVEILRIRNTIMHFLNENFVLQGSSAVATCPDRNFKTKHTCFLSETIDGAAECSKIRDKNLDEKEYIDKNTVMFPAAGASYKTPFVNACENNVKS